MARVPEEVLVLAATQFGAIGRSQARALGWSYEQERSATENGDWQLSTKRVLTRTGAPQSFARDAMVALLDAGGGSVLSMTTSVATFGVPGFSRYPIHVSRPRGTRSRESKVATVHQPTYLPSHHLLVVNGLPCTSPTRALFDLASMREVHPQRLKRAVNSAWADRLTSRELLTRMEAEWCERGRRGSAFMHEYLEERPIGWTPPASRLEGRFIELIVGAGMPSPLSQANVGDDDSWIGRVDLRDPEFPKLLAEIDSDRFHIAPLDAASDENRDERLTAAGFRIVRFSEFKVWHRPSEVIAEWRTERARMRQSRTRHEILAPQPGFGDRFEGVDQLVTDSVLLAPDLVTGSAGGAARARI